VLKKYYQHEIGRRFFRMPHHKSLVELKARVKLGQKESLDLSEYCLEIEHTLLLHLNSKYASIPHTLFLCGCHKGSPWLSAPRPKMVTNSFGKRNFMQPMARIRMQS
jgi:hypothetical protein